MDENFIKSELCRIDDGYIIPSAFIDHVRSCSGRSIEACLNDPLPTPIHRIEIPENLYDLDELYRACHQFSKDMLSKRPKASFEIHATTWKELSAATLLFQTVPENFDIYPVDIYLEKDVALVCCNT